MYLNVLEFYASYEQTGRLNEVNGSLLSGKLDTFFFNTWIVRENCWPAYPIAESQNQIRG